MRTNILFLVLISSFITNAQTKTLTFEYDQAGNQEKRLLCVNCPYSTAKSETKEITELTEDDLLKFSDQDVISYYPNPVKEELYLQWLFTDNRYVTNIQVFSISGQLLTTYRIGKKDNSENISFQNYPSGVYAVLLNYNKGDQKSIKIIKK